MRCRMASAESSPTGSARGQLLYHGHLVVDRGQPSQPLARHGIARGISLPAGSRGGGLFPERHPRYFGVVHPRDRGKAIGILLMGLSLGALLGPPVIAALTLKFGWRAMFLLTGALGFTLLIPWTILYRRPEAHPWVTPGERDYLVEVAAVPTGAEARIPVRDFLRYRAVWTVIAARVLLDSTNYFFLLLDARLPGASAGFQHRR